MRAYEQLKASDEIVIISDDEEELARQITISIRDWFLSRERGKKWGLSVNSDEF